jgi:hypothetical protein
LRRYFEVIFRIREGLATTRSELEEGPISNLNELACTQRLSICEMGYGKLTSDLQDDQ